MIKQVLGGVNQLAQALTKNENVIEHEKRSRLPGKSTYLYRHDVVGLLALLVRLVCLVGRARRAR